MTWLIASLGTSPSVLTEALWYLESQKGLTVDRLTCVGTQDSWAKAQQELFVPGGALERLRTHLGKPGDWMTESIGFEKVIVETADNRDLTQALAMDQAFRQAIRLAQDNEDHDGPVIACISGGRKTMSGSLQQAMVLLARNEDWAFHVLLNLPKGIIEKAVIDSGFGFPGDPAHPAYAEVGVDAFEVPLVRLREFAATKKLDLADESLVEKLQRAVDETQRRPRLTLELGTLRLRDDERPEWRMRLSPQHALILAAFAMGTSPLDDQQLLARLSKTLLLWETLDVEEGSKDFPTTVQELRDKAMVEWLDTDPQYLEQQIARLKRLLEKEDPALHIFSIRREAKGQPRGFAHVVYEHELIKIAL